MDKIVKGRKVHACHVCEGNIQKGEKHTFGSIRQPTYDNSDNQIGVEYLSYRYHLRDCTPRSFMLSHNQFKTMWKNCGVGLHKWGMEEVPGPWYNECGEMNETGRIVCEYCGRVKDAIANA